MKASCLGCDGRGEATGTGFRCPICRGGTRPPFVGPLSGVPVSRFIVVGRMLDEQWFDAGMLEQMIAIENGLSDPPVDDWFELGAAG